MSGACAQLCPSAQPEMRGAQAFGVVSGAPDERRVTWIERPVPVTPELLAMSAPVPPTRVMRFAARCQESACSHFDGHDCRLASRIVAMLDPVVAALPPCSIRADCRWWRQEGREACSRCPQIITETVDPPAIYERAATPEPKAGMEEADTGRAAANLQDDAASFPPIHAIEADRLEKKVPLDRIAIC